MIKKLSIALGILFIILGLNTKYSFVKFPKQNNLAQVGGVNCSASVPSGAFSACYYNGVNFNTPTLSRTDTVINFDWGNSSPGAGVNADFFSARWEGDFNFQAGTYNFTVTIDDGARLYIDGELLLNEWHDEFPTTYTINKTLSAGVHRVKMEYYEDNLTAVAKLSWALQSGGASPSPAPSPAPSPTPTPAPPSSPAPAPLAAPSFSSSVHNILHTFRSSPLITQHAAQMGYDYVSQSDAHARGLKRMVSLNANTVFLQNRDGAYKPGISQISISEYDRYACIKDLSATDPALRYYVEWVNPGPQISFFADYRHQSSITAALNYFSSTLNWSDIDAGFIDQADTSLPYESPAGNPALFSSWSFGNGGTVQNCLNSGAYDYTVDQGFQAYRRGLRDVFRSRGLPVSANPFRVYSDGQEIEQNAPMDHYFNESGENNNSSAFGIIAANKVTVEVPYPPRSGTDQDYGATLAVAGTAGRQGSWFGSYGESFEWMLNDALTAGRPGMNAIQLLRAMPNWDNLVGATGRSWNGAVYTSSNSYADNNIVYSRHGKTGKIFAVFRSASAAITLRNGESIISVKCVDDLFLETGDCATHLSRSGTSVALTSAGLTNRGYIITLGASQASPPPPPPAPQPAPTPVAVPPSAPPPPSPNSTKFSVGQLVQATAVLNVRTLGAANASLLGTQAIGAVGTIVSGGTYADGYYWWNVNYNTGVDGWSAEDFLAAYTPPAPITCSASVPSGAFSACYYNGTNFNTPALSRTDATINFDWGNGSPGAGVNADQFSARWEGDFNFQAGTYDFTTIADDGVKIYIDGQIIIDKWFDQAPTTYTATKNLTAGNHRVKMEYYENGYGAVARLTWLRQTLVDSSSQTTISSPVSNPVTVPVGTVIPTRTFDPDNYNNPATFLQDSSDYPLNSNQRPFTRWGNAQGNLVSATTPQGSSVTLETPVSGGYSGRHNVMRYNLPATTWGGPNVNIDFTVTRGFALGNNIPRNQQIWYEVWMRFAPNFRASFTWDDAPTFTGALKFLLVGPASSGGRFDSQLGSYGPGEMHLTLQVPSWGQVAGVLGGNFPVPNSTFTDEQWHRFRGTMKVDPVTGVYKVWIDNTLIKDWTGNSQGNMPLETWGTLGPANSNAGWKYPTYYDVGLINMFTQDPGWVGTVSSQTLIPPSNISQTNPTRLTKPPIPQFFSASPGSVKLSWGSVSYEYCSKIEIYKSTSTVITYPTVSSKLLELSCGATGYDDKDVTSGILYYYTLFTVDDQGTYSDPATLSFRAPEEETSAVATSSKTVTPILSKSSGGGGRSSGGSSTIINSVATYKFKAGERIVTTDSVNVRNLPSALGIVAGVVKKGTSGTVILGPINASGYTWWQVKFDSGLTGWSVENFLIKPVTNIYTPTTNTTQTTTLATAGFVDGEAVLVTVSKLNVRSTPNGVLAGQQSINSPGKIVGGPTSSAGYLWWKVDFASGVDGWVVQSYISKYKPPAIQTTSNQTSNQATQSNTASTQTTSSSVIGIGKSITTTAELNVRKEASLSSSLLGRQPLGAKGVVVEGLRLSGGYIWWKVDFNSGDDGWVVSNFLR